MKLELQPLKELIKLRCGLVFDGISEENLHRAVLARLEKRGMNQHEYFQEVVAREEEFDELVSLLTINETYFYREAEQLALLTERLIPRLLARLTHPRPIRILSAGCSTGEEPYSIAIALFEAFGEQMPGLVTLLAGDIDQQALQKAREAIYTPFSFRGLPDALRDRYFTRQSAQSYRLNEPVRKLVSFYPLNLLSEQIDPALGEFDIIFFRNVSIYFDTATRHAILKNLHGLLAEQGVLVVGAAESMANDLGVFRLAEEQGNFYFVKAEDFPGETSPSATRPPSSRPLPAPRLLRRPLPASSRRPVSASELLAEAGLLIRDKRYEEAGAVLRGILENEPGYWQARLLLGWVHLQQRHFVAAAKLADQVLKEQRWSLDAMLLHGFAARWQGDQEGAARWFKQAVYIRHDCWVAQYYLAEAYRALGHAEPARRAYRLALQQLNDQPEPNCNLNLPLGLPLGEIRFLCEQHSNKLASLASGQ